MSIGYKKQSSASVPTPAVGEMNTFIDSADDKLKRKDSTGAVTNLEEAASGVSSFEGRTGTVTATAGDYTAAEITNVPAGDIVAATVQAAINELDSEKAPITHVGAGGPGEHPIATGSVAGFMSPSDKTKIDTVTAGATPNSSDAYLLARSNHTGTQTSSTVSDFTAAADARITVQKGAASGLAPLNGASKIDQSYLPVGTENYKGGWSAAVNAPTLVNGTGTTGDEYRVTVAGTQDLGAGSVDYIAGDALIYSGSVWERIGRADLVVSVNGQVGVVSITSLPPNGAASGDLTGTYPAPTIAALAVTTAKLDAGAVTDAKVTDVAFSKITGAPTSYPPNGAATGDLTGSYPAPTIAALAVTAAKLGALAVTTDKLDTGAVTDAKVTDVAFTKITGAPTSYPPNGAASGDLTGSYPAPTLTLTGVSAGSYGDLEYGTSITVDAKGRLTSAASSYRMQKQAYTNETITIPDNYTWLKANTQFLGTTSVTLVGSARLKII